ncbi:FUSC family protein [Novosphingobium sp. 9]|uniref:FUSC family protein n=1 Tax=Novosphingobium sp. 9 TaxID=2025349 RepID=UPI0021B635E1|nr:FUSC family protein [Novosphingobium sp. 9]
MLAVYIALTIGLDRPFWSFLTAYIVAQPLAGTVVSKALFRVIGTFTGGCMAVLLVPNLVNTPVLLTLAMAGWLALCVFVSMMDRTPRSYMFVLAGYTTAIVAFPVLDAPQDIFTYAVLRVQEITLGIVCGSFVHALVLPRSVAGFLLGRVDGILADAERWSLDLLQMEPDPSYVAERRRLAQDVTELHQLSVHLPFETNRIAPRVRTVRALQDQLSLLMPLGAAVADRIAGLREAGGLPDDVCALLADTRGWISRIAMPREDREAEALQLIARCHALEPALTADSDWRALMLLSLTSRLADLIAAHRDARALAEQMATPGRRPVSLRVAELLEGRRGREVHRDYSGALRGAIGAFLTMAVGMALWIGSGWQDGSTGVMLAAVFLALFAAAPNPIAPLKAFFFGTLIATVVGGIMGYAILPRVTNWPEFIAVFAPPMLVLGSLMHSPRWMGIALPTMLGVASPLLISQKYVSNFPAFVNGNLSELVGIAFAIVMVRLLQSAGAEDAVRKTIRIGWREIGDRANLMGPPNVRGWINTMLDRIALLSPRLVASGLGGNALYDALRDLRTGVAIGELRQLRLAIGPEEAAPLTRVLGDVGTYYRRLDPADPTPPRDELLHDIDAATDAVLAHPRPMVRRAGVLGLLSLRRNLFPEAAPLRGPVPPSTPIPPSLTGEGNRSPA